MYFTIPERRKDLRTREEFDRIIGEIRNTLCGLLFLKDLTNDTRTDDMIERCDTEITWYMQQDRIVADQERITL